MLLPPSVDPFALKTASQSVRPHFIFTVFATHIPTYLPTFLPTYLPTYLGRKVDGTFYDRRRCISNATAASASRIKPFKFI